MKFSWPQKSVFLKQFRSKSELFSLEQTPFFLVSEIKSVPSVVIDSLPKNIVQLSQLAAPYQVEAMVMPVARAQDFWSANGLDKKIKKIVTPLNLHHPRAITAASQSVQRLIARQNFPETWSAQFGQTLKKITQKTTKYFQVTVYFGSSEIGSSDWLPELTSVAQENALQKIIKNGFAALYSERFIRERLQRGWSHEHLPVTMVITALESRPVTNRVTFRSVHPVYRNSALAQFTWHQPELATITMFKPALTTKKALIINQPSKSEINDAHLRSLLAPIISLEQKNKQPLVISGIFNQVAGTMTVLRLDFELEKSPESLYEYVLSHTSPILASGEFFGQGIAVGAIAVARINRTAKLISAGTILVAKNLAAIPENVIAEAAGCILEESIDTARVSAKVRQITLPILAGVKGATKKFRTGTMVTVANVNNEGLVYSGALPYEVKPLAKSTQKIKTEIRPTRTHVTIDELIGLSGAQHPLVYLGKKNNQSGVYVQKISQALALAVAEQYPARVTVAFSNSLPRVFTQWPGGKSAEQALRLRPNARGAERYLLKQYEPILAAECAALKQVREQFGFTHIDVQLPYCRSSVELEELMVLLSKHGLTRESGWRFSLATDVPGHAILTTALAKHLDELIFDIDSLVKSTTGARLATMTPIGQKTVEQALQAITKAAHKEAAKIALSGSMLATEPRLVWSAVKSGIKTLVVAPEEESHIRQVAWEAEHAVGLGGVRPQFLSTMAGIAGLSALIITVGAGCGAQQKIANIPQMTPAEIRTEIMADLAAEREVIRTEQTITTVKGFADFKVTHPRRYQVIFSPTELLLTNQDTGEVLRFSVANKFSSVSSTDFLTTSNLSGKTYQITPPAALSETEVQNPKYFSEIELVKNKILRIESAVSSPEITAIANSIQLI